MRKSVSNYITKTAETVNKSHTGVYVPRGAGRAKAGKFKAEVATRRLTLAKQASKISKVLFPITTVVSQVPNIADIINKN